jgi:D-alanyl-D-alanine carboxypeptidase
MKYKKQGTMEEYNSIMDDSAVYADLLGSKLCVVPVGSDTGDDGNLAANATLLVNRTTNEMLYADNIYEKLYPASITKVMTALVTLENADLSDTVSVSYNASHIDEPGATVCGLKEGDKIKLEDLLTIFLISSGNDAGIALAEHVAGSVEEFAKLMNKKAASIGAVHSNFVNPHGLHDDNHYTTAYDIYLFFNEALKQKKFVEIINTPSYTVKYKDKDGKEVENTFKTTNQYLKGVETAPEGITVIGGKTGTTNKAGSCLALYTKDDKDQEYISIILKSEGKSALYSQMSYLLKIIKK